MESTVGRPTKFKESFCERVIELGKQGMGFAEIAANLDVRHQTVKEWMKNFPAFSLAMLQAREHSMSWWEEKGRENLFDGKESRFNDRLWMLNMTNRFPQEWRDRRTVELTGADGGPIELASVDQIRAELERRGRLAAIDVSAFTDVEVIPEKKLLNQPDDSTTKPKDEK